MAAKKKPFHEPENMDADVSYIEEVELAVLSGKGSGRRFVLHAHYVAGC